MTNPRTLATTFWGRADGLYCSPKCRQQAVRIRPHRKVDPRRAADPEHVRPALQAAGVPHLLPQQVEVDI